MFDLFMSMMKEEWRLHSTLFGSLSFALFPVLIGAISFMGAILLPLFRELVPAGDIAFFTNASFLLLGVMVGAFGLIGNEIMNRRFGQASLITCSARTLPLSERSLFATFVIKDIIYYCLLWVFPFVAGFALATPFSGVPWTVSLHLSVTLTLSFLTGLSAVFFLSTIYNRSRWVFALVFLLMLCGTGLAYAFLGAGMAALFPPFQLLYRYSLTGVLANMTGITVLFSASILLFSADHADSTSHYPNTLVSLTSRLSRSPYPAITAKDLIDLHRSGSDIGHIIFSLILPLGILWFFIAVLSQVIPGQNVFFLFSAITGVFSATMYTWFTASDAYSTYASLPVGVAGVIKSKICSFSLLQPIPAVILIVVTLVGGDPVFLPTVLILWGSIAFYALAVTIYLTGLSPHVLVYDAKVLLFYLVAVGGVVLFMTALTFINPNFSITALVLLPLSWFVVKRGLLKWEARDQPGF
jgi:hypothetical protein